MSFSRKELIRASDRLAEDDFDFDELAPSLPPGPSLFTSTSDLALGMPYLDVSQTSIALALVS